MAWQLVAKPEKAKVRSGTPITLWVTLKNTTDHSLSYSNTMNYSANFFIVVKDSEGKLLPFTRWGMAHVYTVNFMDASSETGPPLVEKGSVFTYPVWPSRLYDMTATGDYFVTVRRIINDDRRNARYYVTSNTVHVSVLDTAYGGNSLPIEPTASTKPPSKTSGE